jgi:RNA polymerase primary sigma factor
MSLSLTEKELNTVEDMGIYMHQIRQFPRLTEEEEKTLALRCAEGDEEAIRTMVSANLRLVVSIAREYTGRGVSLMDLIQEGSIGLLVAARRFDPTLEYRFSTYATKWIRQGVSRCVRNQADVIRVPLHTGEKIRKLLKARTALQQQTGEMPTSVQLAEECDMPVKKVEEYLQLLPQISSLDAPAGSEEAVALQLLLENVHAPQPQEELVRRELKQLMEQLLCQLTERQQQVLRLRFGLDDGQARSLEQTGKELGISKERARQLEHAAMDKLRQMGGPLGLEDFLE